MEQINSNNNRELTQVCFSPDGTMLLTSSGDHIARLWEVNSETQLAVFEMNEPIAYLNFSFDGTKIAVASHSNNVYIWDTLENQPLFEPIFNSGNPEGIYMISFSPDKTRVLIGTYIAELWDISSGQRLLSLPHYHADSVFSVGFSPDGSQAVTGGRDCLVRIWSLTTGKVLNSFESYNEYVYKAFFVSADEIITGSYGGVQKWKLADIVEEMCFFKGYQGNGIVSLSPDGKMLATSDDKGKVLFWFYEGPRMGELRCIYPVVNPICAIHWVNSKQIILADKGQGRIFPHIYPLELEVLE